MRNNTDFFNELGIENTLLAKKMMKNLKTSELRQLFLNYFQQHQHQLVDGSSLIPAHDPSLLFTNAGMVAFKEYFLGQSKPPYACAVSAQRCVRAGGKHNDLDNVGYTARHHTFFEMLGNFSFGAYFKHHAIKLAWEFLTQVLEIPSKKLWISVYKDDLESLHIWTKEMGIHSDRVSLCGKKDNFWSMGNTGPCGPCTEIFFDHGEQIKGAPPGSNDKQGERYVEIWNIVLMQYHREADGRLVDLPKPCVDTGMGLERMSAVLQGMHDNYDIDLFKTLLKALSSISGCHDFTNTSMRVIVDHIRSCSFLIADGVTPSNEGRGYVLRRIIRRAIRHGHKLGLREIFFHQLVPSLVATMGEAYPDLATHQPMIERLLEQEEKQFIHTLKKGLKIFEQAVSELSTPMIPGTLIFQLYDTFGFPLDLTADMARERGLNIDRSGFEKAMKKQRLQSQKVGHFAVNYMQALHLNDQTVFTGYKTTQQKATLVHIVQDQKPVLQLALHEKGALILDKTPFYAEAGGQIGDSGYIVSKTGCFKVQTTQKHHLAFLHWGQVEQGRFQVGDELRAEVDSRRQQIACHHSATHLLHQALREILGTHIKQKGSLVDEKRLRFDFSYEKAISADQISQVEYWVNRKICDNVPSQTLVTSQSEAKAMGALALFGEKYEKNVRVVRLGDSIELCGGTHVKRTGDIGCFKITTQASVASGIRRIEAMTGDAAMAYIADNEASLQKLALMLKTHPSHLLSKTEQMLQSYQAAYQKIDQLKQQLASWQGRELYHHIQKIGTVEVLAFQVQALDRATLHSVLDYLKSRLTHYALILASIEGNQVDLVASVSKSVVQHFTAVELFLYVAKQIGARGGGKPLLAEGRGPRTEHLAKALNSVSQWIEQKALA